jgi:exodeoxyribonuclease VII large subunit
LKRGYTLTYKNNKIVKSAEGLTAGDAITIKFADGEKTGTIA